MNKHDQHTSKDKNVPSSRPRVLPTDGEDSPAEHARHALRSHAAPDDHAHPEVAPGTEAAMLMDEALHGEHGAEGHEMAHDGHDAHDAHVDHSGHEDMFRQRFWVSLLLSIPVLLYSPMLQMWLGFTPPAFPGSTWIDPLFSIIVFFYGGVPFLQMAWPELQQRQPGMMTLISLAISVAFVYSSSRSFCPAPRASFGSW